MNYDVTNLLQISIFVAALLGPISHIPSLRRIIMRKTSDGMTVTLEGIGLVSYGGWLGLVDSVHWSMFFILILSTILQVIGTLYVRRWLKSSWLVLAYWLAVATATYFLTKLAPVVGVVIIFIIDVAWNYKAVRDIYSSVAAQAVSVWGWVCSIGANAAWVVESFRSESWLLFFQCVALTACSVAALVATKIAHGRQEQKPTIPLNM